MIRPFHEKFSPMKRSENQQGSPLTIIRNFTLEPFFEQYLSQYNENLTCTYAYLDDVLRSASPIASDTLIILHLPYLTNDAYYNFYKQGSKEAQRSTVQSEAHRIFTYIQNTINLIDHNYNVYIALFTPTENQVILDGQVSFDLIGDNINASLIKLSLGSPRIIIINTTEIFRNIGRKNYYSRVGLYVSESALSRLALNRIAHELTSRMMQRETFVKCLVLDCDNVLWGGIIDEVGVNGIILSNNGLGRVYRDFQRELLKLKSQGYILTICSKNDEVLVKKVFDENPYMLIKATDIAAFEVSFMPKSQGVVSLSKKLNMPIEEMVLLDDSHYEISEVSSSTNINTILLDSNKPHQYIECLYSSGLFYNAIITDDDFTRAKRYTHMVSASSRETTPEQLNLHLETEVTIRFALRSDISRISELSNRTHQFNMSGIKYDYNELKQVLDSKRHHAVVMQVKDKFGDLGTVAAAIISCEKESAIIESLFVSCRVLGRNLEYTFINQLRKMISDIYGYELKWKAVYVPTSLNKSYGNFYDELSIQKTSDLPQ